MFRSAVIGNPISFDYELPGGDMIEVNALVIPGRPARPPDLNHPGDPAEDPVIEITDCFLRDSRKNNPDLPIDLSDLYLRQNDKTFKHIITDMEEVAWETLND